MSHVQITLFIVILVLLISMAGFSSAAETALLAINRYRLRHKAQKKKGISVLILKLLKRPDRLLGTILIVNNGANMFASALATLLAVNLFGEKAVIVTASLLTVVVLVCAEIAPKTLAVLYSERVAKIVAWPVYIFLILFYPIVWLLNIISNGVLRLCGVKLTGPITAVEPLSREELRSVVYETSGRISSQYQTMLLGILDLNKMTVDDVMVPSHSIIGIDLAASWQTIACELQKSEYDWLPVYRENINQIVGMLHLRELMRESLKGAIDQDKLLALLHEPYFIPEGAPLNIQLFNFQHKRKRTALVVDEYGEILGLLTLEDILEEIVGEFTTNVATAGQIIEAQSDGSFLVNGAMTVREINRVTQWNFPTKESRTLNGLITEQLEAIPQSAICMRIAGHPIEIIKVKENRVELARIFPMR